MSVGNTVLGSITPLAAARAGTTNDAGGYLTNVDCRGYQNLSLLVSTGVVGTSADCEVKFSATSGGSFTSTSPASSIAQITVSGTVTQLDIEVPVGKPWAEVHLVTVGSTTVSSAILYGHQPHATNRP